MSNAGNQRLTKNERREQAREAARKLREAEARKAKTRKWAIQGGIIVVALAAVVVVTLVITNSVKPAGPGPLNMASHGILFKGENGQIAVVETPALPASGAPVLTQQDRSGAVANIVIWEDYQCPACRAFETTNLPTIKTMVQKGAATLEIHPISILDRESAGTMYSTRAANAAACVANWSPQSFLDLNDVLYANQPAEQTTGLTNAQLKGFIDQIKAASADQIKSCIDSGQFTKFITAASNLATSGPLGNGAGQPLTGTPTVVVNGQYYDNTKHSLTSTSEFQAFLLQAVSAGKTSATPSNAASPAAS